LKDIFFSLEDLVKIIPSSLASELYDKAVKILKSRRGLRRPRKSDVFIRRFYLYPEDVSIENFRRKALAVFNPGVVLRDNEIYIFPRTVFDYYWYVSSISLIRIRIREFVEESFEKPVKARIILSPKNIWELGKGLEDPRVTYLDDKFHILYTAVAPSQREIIPLQAYAVLNSSLEDMRRGFIKIIADEEYIIYPWKDSALLDVSRRETTLMTRPTIRYEENVLEIGWRGIIDLDNLTINHKSLEPVFPFEEWELKTGWSTNVLKISSNEYLIGWHAVLRSMIYANGLAIIDEDGELKAVSDYMLVPETFPELYGDRPGVIFGCGLIKINDLIYWIGGVSDFAIGVYVAELDKIFENMRDVKIK